MRLLKRLTINREVVTYGFSRGRDHFVSRGLPVGNVKSSQELYAALDGHLGMLRENGTLAREIRLFLSKHKNWAPKPKP